MGDETREAVRAFVDAQRNERDGAHVSTYLTPEGGYTINLGHLRTLLSALERVEGERDAALADARHWRTEWSGMDKACSGWMARAIRAEEALREGVRACEDVMAYSATMMEQYAAGRAAEIRDRLRPGLPDTPTTDTPAELRAEHRAGSHASDPDNCPDCGTDTPAETPCDDCDGTGTDHSYPMRGCRACSGDGRTPAETGEGVDWEAIYQAGERRFMDQGPRAGMARMLAEYHRQTRGRG